MQDGTVFGIENRRVFPKTKQNKTRLQCPPEQIPSALLKLPRFVLFCFVLLAREGGQPDIFGSTRLKKTSGDPPLVFFIVLADFRSARFGSF